MITGKIIVTKEDTWPAVQRLTTAFPWLNERDDDGYLPNHKPQGPPMEERIKSLIELNNKTLPEQGWVIGAKVIRTSQAEIKPVGTIIAFSYDPIRAYNVYRNEYQSILVKFVFASGNNSTIHYTPEELTIIEEQSNDNQDNQDQQKAG